MIITGHKPDMPASFEAYMCASNAYAQCTWGHEQLEQYLRIATKVDH